MKVHSLRLLALLMVPTFAGVAKAQFVWPKADEHNTDPSVYKEDPFITEYRQKFFAVFKGDFKTFNKAFDDISAMVAKDPKDARALVWLGNGQTIKAGFKWLKGDKAAAMDLLNQSWANLDKAVSIKPEDPAIFMMRAATLYVEGQYMKGADLPNKVWLELSGDCEHLVRHIGAANMNKLSVHARGETYGEMAVAYLKLNKPEKAKAALQTLVRIDPKTAYSMKAEAMLKALSAGGVQAALKTS